MNPRIMMVEPLGDGGICHYAFNLVNALEDTGTKCLLYTTSRYEFSRKPWRAGSLRMGFFRLCFKIIEYVPALDRESGLASIFRRLIKVFEYPFDALEAAFLARRRGVEIVHLQSVNFVDVIMVLCARMVGLKVVTTVHNVNPLHGELRRYHKWIFRWFYGFSHRVIIHTEAGKGELTTLFSVDPDRVVVIPHGDYSFFTAEAEGDSEGARGRVGIVEDAKTILFFGAIRANKGLDVLIEAMPAILASEPRARLLIVGEVSGDFGVYRRRIDELGLGDAVHEVLKYVGNQEVADYFHSTDVAVLPYREITQSGVIQVALAFARPVIATDLPGFRDIIEHGRTGWLVPGEDPQSLADCCIRVLADPLYAVRVGEAGRQFAMKEFSWSTIARRTVSAVYDNLA